MVKKILLSLIGVLVFAAGAFAQAKQVRGSVVDENGAAVIGASVIVKGTTIGVSTDQQGFFVMNNVPAKSEELQISYLGYKTATVAVAPEVKVTLEPDSQTVETVVVTGMTKTDKRLFTGASDQYRQTSLYGCGGPPFRRGCETFGYGRYQPRSGRPFGRCLGAERIGYFRYRSQDPRPRCDVDSRQLEAALGCGRRHYGGCRRYFGRGPLFG